MTEPIRSKDRLPRDDECDVNGCVFVAMEGGKQWWLVNSSEIRNWHFWLPYIPVPSKPKPRRFALYIGCIGDVVNLRFWRELKEHEQPEPHETLVVEPEEK